MAGTVFCGVFDGHGPHGHLVAKNVGAILPDMLASCWNSRDCQQDLLASPVRDSLVQAYKIMDRELLIHDNVDCVFSGTTAVTLVRQVCCCLSFCQTTMLIIFHVIKISLRKLKGTYIVTYHHLATKRMYT